MNTTHSPHLSVVGTSVFSFQFSKFLSSASRIGLGRHEYAGSREFSNRVVVWRSFAIGAASIGFFLVDAEAAITFSNPVRSVSASNNKESSQVIEKYDFEPFNESARVDWEEYWSYPNTYYGPYPNITGQYFSEATQESIVGLTGVVARGSVLGTGSFDFYGQNPLQQHAHSYFKINMLLSAPGSIHLNGLIKSDYDPWGTNIDVPEIIVTLTGVNGEYYSKNISYFEGHEYEYEINESFMSLPAGQYDFEVSVKTAGDYRAREISYDDEDVWIDPGVGGGGNASYDITLSLVPEPSSMLMAILGGLLILTRRAR